MQLRDYQQQAVDSVWRFLRKRQDNPCLVLPTGAGKSLVMATLCRTAVRDWQGRVLILAHVKELLVQIAEHLTKIDPTLPVGIFSAGLGAKDAGYAVTVAGIQSAANAPDLFSPDLVIIDEVHRLPPDGEGQYRTLLASIKSRIPHVRLIGLTATPFRTKSGALCKPDGIINAICFEVGIRELVARGYLSVIHSRGPAVEDSFDAVKVTAGEYNQQALEAHMNDDEKVMRAVCDIVQRTAGRRKILVFASGVDHGAKVADMLRSATDEAVGEVYGETDSDERAETIKSFRDGALRWLVNRDVLTLGFDAPNVDCVVLLRATLSPGLYYQMVGRGFRIAEGKADCLVLDYGGNVLRHGKVDELRIDERTGEGDGRKPEPRKCPQCNGYSSARAEVCEECGAVFPKEEREKKAGHESDAYDGEILGDGKPEWVDVVRVDYSKHEKDKLDGSVSRTLRVDYSTGLMDISEWVCLEHGGYAGEKARHWWARRFGEPVPQTVDEALDAIYAANGDMIGREPKSILVGREGKYRRVLDCKF